MARHVPAIRRTALFALLILFSASCGAAQTASRLGSRTLPSSGSYLVFPFEKLDAAPHLDWLGEALAELTISRLASAGQQAFSRNERIAELERYGLPPNSKLSRASMLRIAQDLDADCVVFGAFSSDGATLRVEARLLTVTPAALSPAVRENSPLDSLMDLDTRMVWQLLSRHVPAFPLSLAALSSRQSRLRMDAFEHYIRGLIAADDDARIRELREAARLDPPWPDPAYALGQTYLQRSDCAAALSFFGRVPRSDPHYREAQFSQGVCRLLLNQPDQAESIFVSLQDSLRRAGNSSDFPELLNDLAIARARLGKTASAIEDLRRAADLDPDEDDYTFNLGLLALRANSPAGAVEHFRQASESQPDNSEDRALLIYSLEKDGKKDEAAEERSQAQEAFGPNGLPSIQVDPRSAEDSLAKLDRLKLELDPAEFRLENLSPGAPGGSGGAEGNSASSANAPAAHARRGRLELSAGNLAAAEQEFRSVLAADPKNSAAHLGLAEIRRKQSNLDDAVLELHASLQSRDSAAVRTTLARVYLEQKRPDLARAEVDRALALAPNYAPAKQLLEYLQKTGAGSGSPPAVGPNPKPGARNQPSPAPKPSGGVR